MLGLSVHHSKGEAMSRSIPAVLIATALLGALLVAPAAAQSPAPAVPGAAAAIIIDCDAFTATPNATAAVDAPAGSAVIVSLCSNPSTGFRWADPASSDATTASVDGWTYEAPADPTLAGAAGTEVLTLVAGATGHATVTASYDQPWEGGQKGAWTLMLDVVVRDAVPVTIDCAAFGAGTAATAAVDAPVGSAVVLTVCSNASTGYTWTEPSSSDPAVAVPGEWVSVAPAEPMPGAPGSQVLTIAADSAGTAVITASYDRPWEGGEKGAWTLELTINVQ
jgi:inhibitor of cysteine peptidase